MFKNIKNKYALLLGNHLDSAKEDIDRMNKLLTRLNFNCVSFFNCFPKEEIIKFINNNKLNFDDLLYVHFSGHGNIKGIKVENKMIMISSWVNPDISECYSIDIDKILSKINCNIILISDTCHSEKFGEFYTGNKPFLFIGSSSIVMKSYEYNFVSLKKTGALTLLFEHMFKIIFLDEITIDNFKKETISFFNKNRIRVKPIIKYLT